MKKTTSVLLLLLVIFLGSNNISAQCTFTTSAPYFQNFAGVSTASPLPQCWTTLGQANTSTVGTGSAYFYFSPQGSNYFFTQGIQLYAGVVYSISIFYLSDLLGNTNWSNLSLLLGTSQSTTGLVNIASTSGPAVAPVYTPLTNTFIVGSSGIYYVAMKGTCNGSGSPYLTLDDLAITIPCSLNPSFLNISASNTLLCLGQSATINANGASTYTWNNGSNLSVITVTPNSNTNYLVNATNSLGCVSSKSISIQVNPNPLVLIISNKMSICTGESTTLNAVAGSTAANLTFSWSNGATTYSTVLSPTISTNYSVTITNSYNCSASGVQHIAVNPLPNVTATASGSFVCAGDEVLITCSGAVNYTWTSSLGLGTGTTNPFTKPLANNEFLTITGKDLNGCTKSVTLNLNVMECAGLNEKSLEKRLYVFPNPSNDKINLIGLKNYSSIEIYDLKGQLVYEENTSEHYYVIDLKGFDKGLYVLQIISGGERAERRIIVE